MQYTADDFVNLLYEHGFNFFTGVPCSNQKELLDVIQGNRHHYYSLNPGLAAALSAGAAFTGHLPVVLAQNTEIGDMMAHIAMLFSRYELSGLILTSYRKTYSELKWGRKGASLNKSTIPLIKLLELEYVVLKENNYSELKAFLQKPLSGINFMVMESNVFENCTTAKQSNSKEQLHKQGQIFTNYNTSRQSNILTESKAVSLLSEYIHANTDTAALISEGQLSRKVFEEAALPNVLPLTCALGYTSSIAAGVALCTTKNVLVIEGDGGFLMNLSILPFIGSQKPNNFIHMIMNNGCYVSTGGQTIVNNAIDWDNVAISFGYACAITVKNEEGLMELLENIDAYPKPIFVNLQVLPSVFTSPSISKAPGEISAEFKEFLSRGSYVKVN